MEEGDFFSVWISRRLGKAVFFGFLQHGLVKRDIMDRLVSFPADDVGETALFHI
jgi:hypothetical protein